MLPSSDPDVNKPKKLRTACDTCHQAKMKCSGGNPCSGCGDSGYECFYSASNRIGRPKGTKNKRTLERMGRNQSDTELEQASNKAQDTGIRVQETATQPGLMDFGGITNMATMPMDNIPIDSTFGSNVSYPPPSSAMYGRVSKNLDPWYDFGPGGLSNLKQESSLGSSSDSGTFMNEAMYRYPHDDSAYVSPTTLSKDNRGAGGGLVLANFTPEDSGYSNVTTSFSSPSMSSSTACNCVQNHAELLHSLKDLEQRHATPRLDVILSATQQALVPWKDVIECRVCQRDDNQEVLMLSAMSIRTVLGAMSSLCTDYYSNFVPGAEVLGKQRSLVTTPDGMRSAIGFYEITGNERMAVTDLLISRTLDKVKYTLACFKERLEALKAKKPTIGPVSAFERPYFDQTKIEHDVETLSMGGAGDPHHLLQVWQNLDTTVQMLEGIMRKGNVVCIPNMDDANRMCTTAYMLPVSASVSTSSTSPMYLP